MPLSLQMGWLLTADEGSVDGLAGEVARAAVHEVSKELPQKSQVQPGDFFSCSVTLGKKGKPAFRKTIFAVGQPPKTGKNIGATEQLSCWFYQIWYKALYGPQPAQNHQTLWSVGGRIP